MTLKHTEVYKEENNIYSLNTTIQINIDCHIKRLLELNLSVKLSNNGFSTKDVDLLM